MSKKIHLYGTYKSLPITKHPDGHINQTQPDEHFNQTPGELIGFPKLIQGAVMN